MGWRVAAAAVGGLALVSGIACSATGETSSEQAPKTTKAPSRSTTTTTESTTTTAAEEDLYAEMERELSRACTAAVTSGNEPEVEWDDRWNDLGTEDDLLAATESCIKARKAEARASEIKSFQETLEDIRLDLADALESDTSIGTVDSVTFDIDTGLLRLSVTPVIDYSYDYYTESLNEMNLDMATDDAWEVAKALSTFWEDEGSGFRYKHFSPGLAFTNGTASFECSEEFMIRLGELTADRAAWEAEC